MNIRLLTLLLTMLLVISCASKSTAQMSQMAKIDRSYDHNQYEATGEKFVIATQGPASTYAAKQMFDKGGNIIDAAIAASFAISVERQQSTGIGGGGFMMFYSAKENKTYAIDFREKAPKKAAEKMFQDKDGKVIPKKSSVGIFSSGIPGLVAGLYEIKNKFGSKNVTWADTIQPAIALAENGIDVYPHLAEAINDQKDILSASAYSKKLYFKEDGTPLKLDDKLVQKDLAKTLKIIAEKGKDGFYKGKIAKAIIAESKKHQGLFQQSDFDSYQVKYRDPVVGSFHGFKIASMPPPSSGGTHVIQILKILDGFKLKEQGAYSPQTIHQVSSAMQLAFADRSYYLGDSDFTKVPVQELISDQHIQVMRSKIKDKAIPSKDLNTPSLKNESTETTHFSMMDQEGNVVASTQTVNGFFGSGIVVEGTGIVLNNEMDDFTAKPGEANNFGVIGGVPNSIAPEKRPLSSMSPTILFNSEGKAVLALGSPNGSRIITCVVLTILNNIEFEMPLFEAVSSMRYHNQWYPEEIRVESPGFDLKTQKELENMGYKINKSDYGCRVQSVANDGYTLRGVSDIRGEGMSLGN